MQPEMTVAVEHSTSVARATTGLENFSLAGLHVRSLLMQLLL
jgi:hypothetical protein